MHTCSCVDVYIFAGCLGCSVWVLWVAWSSVSGVSLSRPVPCTQGLAGLTRAGRPPSPVKVPGHTAIKHQEQHHTQKHTEHEHKTTSFTQTQPITIYSASWIITRLCLTLTLSIGKDTNFRFPILSIMMFAYLDSYKGATCQSNSPAALDFSPPYTPAPSKSSNKHTDIPLPNSFLSVATQTKLIWFYA